MVFQCYGAVSNYCSNLTSFGEVYEIVDILCNGDSLKEITMKDSHHQPLPSKEVIIEIVEHLKSILFPGYFGVVNSSPTGIKFNVGSLLDFVLQNLHVQIMRSLCFNCEKELKNKKYKDCSDYSIEITRKFLKKLPEIRDLLVTDVKAAYIGDPAATSYDEAIFCYPGITAIINQRLAHELYVLNVPLIPRIITEHAHTLTGIDIHPGASIDEAFFMDHGTGIVIGETSIIGKRVRIYQGVTLGAKSFPLDENGNPIKGIDRHPVVEDDVIIYSGATILGKITLGARSIIGGNVWVTKDIPPDTKILQDKPRQERFMNGSGI